MTGRRGILILGVWFTLAAIGSRATAADSTPISPDDLQFFEKRVRPVLVERCYECHSAGSKKVKGHLWLDTKEGVLKGGDTGPAVMPGDPDKSLLIQSVRYRNPDAEMPPKGKLPDAEIAALEEWVRRGAPDPRTGGAVAVKKNVLDGAKAHWAYQPRTKPAIPAVANVDWATTDIDRFVLARLEREKLTPAPDADAETLVRRLYFDLWGLPPTPEQVDAFVNDRSADRYERLVDRLLASRHFGERWGRHWLDVARYAESLTLRGFVLKEAWRYRDYVVETFNADRPFDRFMMEQVAGDLLPAPTTEERRRTLVAPAFLAMGNTNLEEQDKKQLEMDVVDEQLETIGRAFLGQTIGCARCHDHKFDPIPTADYYALAGILHSTTTLEHSNVSKAMEAVLPSTPEREAVLREHEAKVAALQAELKAAKATVAKSGKVPAKVSRVTDFPGTVLVDDAQAKRVGNWSFSDKVRSYVGEGYLTDLGEHDEPWSLTFLFEIPETGRYEVRLAYTASPNRATNVPVTVFSADGEKTLTVNQRQAPTIDGHFVSLGTYTFEKGGQGFVIVSNQKADGHVIGDAVQFIPADAKPSERLATGKAAGDESHADAVKRLEAQLKQVQEDGPRREAVISVKEAKAVADERVHVRGSVYTLGETVPRGFLRAVPVAHVPQVPADQSGRRQLAEWLAAADNPLPARVTVNRAWHWLMGAGLVRTTDNFGTTGEAPSHPELLDHLATTFVEDGWSVKRLVRRIVTSRTYRQAVGGPGVAAAAQVDPENRLLARANRKRLEAEAVRDAMLLVSGQLSPESGGSVYKPTLASDFNYKQSDTRRSVYTPVFRNALPEVFDVFDFADPSVSTGRRTVSTVAPQALYMLNHPFVREQAGHAAARLLAETTGRGDVERLELAYRRAVGRRPTDRERGLAMEYLKGLPAEQAKAAWTDVFQSLFGSIDFRYVE